MPPYDDNKSWQTDPKVQEAMKRRDLKELLSKKDADLHLSVNAIKASFAAELISRGTPDKEISDIHVNLSRQENEIELHITDPKDRFKQCGINLYEKLKDSNTFVGSAQFQQWRSDSTAIIKAHSLADIIGTTNNLIDPDNAIDFASVLGKPK